MAEVVLANPQVTVNNVTIAVQPNSVSYTEGKGETIVRAASVGGGQTIQIISDDVSDNFSNLKFAMDPFPINIENARAWKDNIGANVVTLTGTAGGDTITRTFQQASVSNDYEVNLSADGSIDLEWKSEAAV